MALTTKYDVSSSESRMILLLLRQTRLKKPVTGFRQKTFNLRGFLMISKPTRRPIVISRQFRHEFTLIIKNSSQAESEILNKKIIR